MELFFQKFITGITIIGVSIAGVFGFVPKGDLAYLEQRVNMLESQIIEQQEDTLFGSTNFVGGGRYYLSGSGISLTATSIVLRSFKMPVSDQELQMADFGSIGYATIEPGTSKKEFVSFTGVTQASDSDKATLTGVTRGLSFITPYTASTTLRQTHSGGSKLIISNPPQLYNRMAVKDNEETISAVWTFTGAIPPTLDSYIAATSNAQLIAKKYADDLAIAGAVDATQSVKGIVEIADSDFFLSSTTFSGSASTSDTTAELVVPAYMFSTTTQATTTVVVAMNDGKINQNFVDLTEDFTFTGDVYCNASTTLGTSLADYLAIHASTTLYATTTFLNATSSFDRPPEIDSSSVNATSSNFYSLATQGYVDNKIDMFMGYEERNWDTRYGPATTSGMLIGTRRCHDSGNACRAIARAYSDTSSQPTSTTAIYYGNQYAPIDHYGTASFTLPVPKDYYWYASSTGGLYDSSGGLYWIPTQDSE